MLNGRELQNAINLVRELMADDSLEFHEVVMRSGLGWDDVVDVAFMMDDDLSFSRRMVRNLVGLSSADVMETVPDHGVWPSVPMHDSLGWDVDRVLADLVSSAAEAADMFDEDSLEEWAAMTTDVGGEG